MCGLSSQLSVWSRSITMCKWLEMWGLQSFFSSATSWAKSPNLCFRPLCISILPNPIVHHHLGLWAILPCNQYLRDICSIPHLRGLCLMWVRLWVTQHPDLSKDGDGYKLSSCWKLSASILFNEITNTKFNLNCFKVFTYFERELSLTVAKWISVFSR